MLQASQGGPPEIFRQRDDTHLLTSEAQLWQPVTHGFSWVLGSSYTRNSTSLDRAIGSVGDLVPMTGVVNRVEEFTVYGEASERFAPWLTATAGGRISRTLLSGAAAGTFPAISQIDLLERAAITAS